MPVDRSLDPEMIQSLAFTMKAELRKSMSRTRSMLPREQRAQMSRAIVERLIALPAFRAASTVALFRTLTAKGEVDTSALDDAARSAGKRVAYPTIDDDGAIDRAGMSFRFVDDPSSLRARGRGFDEPPPECEPAEVELVIVPGLAFDEQGYRVGYGAGLYDRALANLRATRVGVAYDFQIVVEIPRQAHDVPMSIVVTDKRVIEASS